MKSSGFESSHEQGEVVFVGAGPGAADLLTVRAVRAIAGADVILHDSLVESDVLALAPPACRLLPVGKRGHRPSTPQDMINRLMARYARSGARVVRLKGGDPSVFGRAGEERRYLESLGVRVRVIPGVTTASAAAAQFGFSLTEREAARRVIFATGRTLNGAELDWRSAADPKATLCIYMGCAEIVQIAARLIAEGRAAGTPVLVARDVERSGAHAVGATLQQLAAGEISLVSEGPALIVVGEAAAQAVKEASVLAPERLTSLLAS